MKYTAVHIIFKVAERTEEHLVLSLILIDQTNMFVKQREKDGKVQQQKIKSVWS